MKSIVVRVADLQALVFEISSDKRTFVELSIIDADGEGDNYLPACVSLSALDEDGDFWIDYDEAEEVPDSELPARADASRTNIM